MTIFLPAKTNKQTHSSETLAQKRFHSLQKEIETLHNDLENQFKTLDECLNYYASYIYPQKNLLLDILKKQTKLLYPHYKKKEPFSKKQKNCIKKFMLNRLEKILEYGPLDKDDKELIKIYEHLKNLKYEDVLSEEFELYKDFMQEKCTQDGIDVDLSDLSLEEGEIGLFQRVFEFIEQKQNREKEIPFQEKKKKQCDQKTSKELQKIEIGIIYKQLVKIIHPDLEQDPNRKKEKEELMKRLSVAFKNNDLYTILSLEIEWLNQSKSNPRIDNEERLNIYNQLLQKQVNRLKVAIKDAPYHHQYSHLQNYLNSRSSIRLDFMENELFMLQGIVKSNEDLMNELESENAEKALHDVINFMRL